MKDEGGRIREAPKRLLRVSVLSLITPAFVTLKRLQRTNASGTVTEKIMNSKYHLNRRQFLLRTGLLTAGALLPPRFSWAQAQKNPVGLMLPYTGTYPQLGVALTNGFKLPVNQRGRKLARPELENFHGAD